MLALHEIEAGTTNLVADPADRCKRTVYNHLDGLTQEGHVKKEAEARESFWIDVGLDDTPYWETIVLK